MQLKDYCQKLLSDFDNKAREIQKSLPEKPTKILYHYTSFNNFKRIIEDQEICLTDYRHLNDPTEILLSSNVIEEVVQQKAKGNLKYFWEKFLNAFPTLISEEQFNQEKKNFQNIVKTKADVYTFSLCEKADSLSMFRWYAENGTGVSIGFRPECFDTESIKEGVNLEPV